MMKEFTGIASTIGAMTCALLIGHEIVQSAETPTQWVPLSTQSVVQLAAMGKKISLQKGCNTCHGADYKGKAKFSPSLRANSRLWKEYNAKTFARVMDTGVTEDGGHVKKPMPIYRLKAKDSAALYAYFKTLK